MLLSIPTFACARLNIYNASVYVPTGLYIKNPNPTSNKLDNKEHCDSPGICYSASINDHTMDLAHTPKEFTKANGEKCLSGKVTFAIDKNKSIVVVCDCKDGSAIKAIYKKY